MSDSHAQDIKKEVKVYLSVFIALAFLTIITVAISYFRHNLILGITIALIVATIKASLVACYFMHLISERKLIYGILILVVVFFFSMMFLTLSGHSNIITGSEFIQHPLPAQLEHGKE